MSFVPAWKAASSPTLSCQLIKNRKGLNLGQLTYHIQVMEQGSYPQVLGQNNQQVCPESYIFTKVFSSRCMFPLFLKAFESRCSSISSYEQQQKTGAV